MHPNQGLLIAIEGLDRSGKSTQTLMLAQRFDAQVFRFPDRTTHHGQKIDQVLKNQLKASPSEVNQLFKLNRQEKQKDIKEALKKKQIVILDRYVYSGQAYQYARLQSQQLPLDDSWKEKESIAYPDIVFFIDAPVAVVSQRKEFGQEIYEQESFQTLVYDGYKLLAEPNWFFLDGTLSVPQIHQQIVDLITNRLFPQKKPHLCCSYI